MQHFFRRDLFFQRDLEQDDINLDNFMVYFIDSDEDHTSSQIFFAVLRKKP